MIQVVYKEDVLELVMEDLDMCIEVFSLLVEFSLFHTANKADRRVIVLPYMVHVPKLGVRVDDNTENQVKHQYIDQYEE